MKAFFTRNPKRIEDLQRPYSLAEEREYKIVKTIELTAIEYENFTADMYADRQFIEDNAKLCRAGKIMKSLLIKTKNKSDGILIVPTIDAPVKWAAYIKEIEK